MAFVNIPPNFQDMFYALSDRIAKLETGPNQAMYVAEAAQGGSVQALEIAISAQSVATQAEIQAINAGIEANNAAAQATLASSQATQAQQSANGKNTIYYGVTSTPGTGTIFGASANGTTITYNAYNGLTVGQSVTISGIANNTAFISNATGNGTTVTYTANNNFVVGQFVTVTGINNNPGPPITPPVYNLSGTITSASSTQFSIASTVTGAYSSGGTATAPSLLNTTGTVTSQSFTQFSIASTRRGAYTSGGSLSTNGLSFKVGDLYFQYNTSSQVVAQYSWDGSAWQSTPITNSVITNLDAGKITTGIITSIEYNNGSGTFRVTPAGALTASSATITGTVNAQQGYFGNPATGNYWSIGSSGLTAVGSGTITGGLIQGSSITVPNSSAWKFAVDSAGSLQAVNANITGVITATSGSFSGSIFSTSGTIGGWTIGSTTLSATSGTKTMTLDAGSAILTISDSSSGILSGGGINIISAGVTGSYGARALSFGGSVTFANDGSNNVLIQGGGTSAIRLQPGAGLGSTTYNVQVEGHLNSAAYTLSTGTYDASSTALTTGTYLSASGAIIGRRNNQIPLFASRFSTSGTSEMIRLSYNGADAGGITTTATGVPAFRNASDYRLKSNIQDFVGATDIIKALRLRSFTYNIEPDKTTAGFIAHELGEVLPDLVLGEKDAIDADGNPVYQAITATNLIPYLTGALKDVIVRLEALEA